MQRCALRALCVQPSVGADAPRIKFVCSHALLRGLQDVRCSARLHFCDGRDVLTAAHSMPMLRVPRPSSRHLPHHATSARPARASSPVQGKRHALSHLLFLAWR